MSSVFLENCVISTRVGVCCFGGVYSGTYNGTQVAFKELRKMAADSAKLPKLSALVPKVQQIIHPNVVQLYGLYIHDNSVYTVYKRYDGPLEKLFRNGKSSNYGLKERTHFIIDVATGMEYITSAQSGDGTLSLRNLGYTKDSNSVITVIIGGLDVSYFGKVYDTSLVRSFARKWTSPEVAKEGDNHLKYNEKSDVWSFGVTAWEILNGGRVPFENVSTGDILKKVEEGLRLEEPKITQLFKENGGEKLWNIIAMCFETDPEKRPTFTQIKEQLQNVYNEMKEDTKEDLKNIKEAEKVDEDDEEEEENNY
ncbi:Megakaryocyte-associated tyrosine protein kinase, putative [Entamoeba invadens IP1]|uniref:Megakaryocyte-associated tyrosine protein kinase, putative n=1 Tax=Entamoeba invadens IP1 TaxID=370355 RepID=L7FNN2_ENTIV|nr:Megakaryocyte-associated tyrosine protein kinase, putative [Entamoeba invadens IP1]ELP94521.1 Megakaryocyte-associated tyrosine protein kinase, putative [Entamoeba invadens IP1]|eukprot:XP_004261292.1 Megakaryocyte-associated tyrosine protein kinase, putative [Entamoeba invadens IP1]